MKKNYYLFVLLSTLCLQNFGQSGHNWMSFLSDDKYISNLTIPGTHDSGAYVIDVNKSPNNRYVTQTMTFKEQLNQGVRSFDLRLRQSNSGNLSGDSISVNSSTKFNPTFKRDVLEVMKSFLKNNPREALLMFIQAEQEKNNIKLAQELNKIINSNEYKHLFYLKNNLPKLKDARGKVLLFVNNEIKKYGAPGIGIKQEKNKPVSVTENPKVKISLLHDLTKVNDSLESIGFTVNCDICTFKTKKNAIDLKIDFMKKFMIDSNSDKSNTLYVNECSVYDIDQSGKRTLDKEASTIINNDLKEFLLIDKPHKSYGVLSIDRATNSLIKNIYSKNEFESKIKFYKEINFRKPSPSLSFIDVGKNQISSLIIPAKQGVILYSHVSFKGEALLIEGGNEGKVIKDIRQYSPNWKNKIRSIIVLNEKEVSDKENIKSLLDDFPNTKNYVRVFKGLDFKNVEQGFLAGNFNKLTHSDGVIGKEEISSIVIPAKWQVILYEHENFKGNQIFFDGGNYGVTIRDLGLFGWNNKVSSLTVINYNTKTNRKINLQESLKRFEKPNDLNHSEEINIYPNPAPKGQFTLSLNGAQHETKELIIYNNLGQEVHKQPLYLNNDNKKTAIQANLSNGIYNIIIKNTDGSILEKKLVSK